MRTSLRDYLLQREKLNPAREENMAAWYDTDDRMSMFLNSSDKCVLLCDKSGKSGYGTATDKFLYLNGANGTYASFTALTAFGTGDFSVSAKVRIDSLATAKDIIGSNVNGFILRASITTGTLVSVKNNVGSNTESTTPITVGETVVVGYSRSGTTGTYYINGVAVGTTSDTRDYTVGVGEIGSKNLGTDDNVLGRVYWARVYNAALDATAMAADAAGTVQSNNTFNADFASQGPGTAAFKESSSNQATVTLNGNAKITYVDFGNCLVLPGSNSNDASTTKYIPGAGVFRVETKLKFNRYTTRQAITGVSTSSTNIGWSWEINASYYSSVSISPDGTGASQQTIVSSAIIPDQTEYLAFEMDLVNGTVDFYTSNDGTSWSDLGTQQTFTPITIFNSTALLRIGSVNAGTAIPMAGRVYWAKYYFDGTLVRNFDATAQAKLATSWTAATTGETWTINTTSIALPARIHGERDLYMGTAASQPVYLRHDGTNYGYLNGASGAYFSTPDSAAVSVTGDIEIVYRGALNDWSDGTSRALVSKYDTSSKRSYLLNVNLSGQIQLTTSPDGTATVIAVSDSIAGWADGSERWIKVSRDVDNGSGGNTTKFYTSSDGVTWTQFGSDVVNAGTTSIYDGDTAFAVGAQFATGTAGSFSAGKHYYASVANAISGTPLTSNTTPTAVFNPSDYPLTGGSTFTSSATGETWTINGGALIVDRTGILFDGTDDYMKSAAFSLSQPENVYFVGRQVTWTGGKTFIDGDSGNTIRFYQITATPQIGIYAGTGPTAANSNLPVKTSAVSLAIFNGASSRTRVNRTTEATGNAGSSNGNGFTLGSYANGTSPSNIFVHEVLIYDSTAHNAYQQDRLIMSRGRKWRVLTTP